MVDGYGGNKEKLNDKHLVKSVLTDLPKKLNMKSLCSPEIYFAEGNNLKDPGGWSGFVVIQESHISIHTFPGRRFLSSDIYTCQNRLEKELILGYLRSAFSLTEMEVNLIYRGTKYPNHNL